jgi:hypothetical protein
LVATTTASTTATAGGRATLRVVPAVRGMTDATIFSGRTVAARQSVTTRAVTATVHLVVIDGNDRRPTRCAVTGLAHIGGINMAAGLFVSMAGRTSPKHLSVVHPDHRPPTGGRMAGLTNIGAGNV